MHIEAAGAREGIQRHYCVAASLLSRQLLPFAFLIQGNWDIYQSNN